jgi:FeS assembly SUF system protein
MGDRIIKLTDEQAAATEKAAREASEASQSAGSIFERRNPVRTLELQPRIVEALSTIYDPEIPVNIYELGLVYDTAVDDRGAVGVRMTLTAPACPAAQTLPMEVARKLKELPGVTDARVDIVWDPPWDKSRMSDAARLQLGMF